MRIVTYASMQRQVPVIPKSVSFESGVVRALLLSNVDLTIKAQDFVWLSKSKSGWTMCYVERVEASGVSDLRLIAKLDDGLVELHQAAAKITLIINPRHHKKYKG